MFCISCGFKNPDEARFCMKCGAAVVAPVPASVAVERAAPPLAEPKPAIPSQPSKANPAAKPATSPQRSRGPFDFDGMVGAIAVGLGSLLLAYILATIGYHSMEASTHGASYGSGWYSWFLAAFAVASGGLRMASRIGRK